MSIASIAGVTGASPVERNAITESGHLIAFDRPSLWASKAKDTGCDGGRVCAVVRGTDPSNAVVAEKRTVAATVVVPDTIRSAGALRLLAAYLTTYFHVAVEVRGQVRTVTVIRERRPELVQALKEIARCFC
jgi:hypothetical protein